MIAVGGITKRQLIAQTARRDMVERAVDVSIVDMAVAVVDPDQRVASAGGWHEGHYEKCYSQPRHQGH